MFKENLRSHYDAKYATEIKTESLEIVEYKHNPVNRFEACIKYFSEYFHGGDVLELAAGNGLITRSLMASSSLKIRSYTTTEFSEMRLQGLKKNLHDPRIRIIPLDAEMIPSEEFNKYDAVIMIALIEHLIDPLKAMYHIRKLLRPGGFVYIDTPNIAKYSRRIKLLSGRFPSTASKNEGLTKYENTPVDLHDDGHLHYFTYRSLSLMLTERCNFSQIKKLAYFCGKSHLGCKLAHVWPQMFSELVLIAYA